MKKLTSAVTAAAMSILLGITCFAEEIGASTVVGASSGNTNTGVQFDPTIYIVCGVALAVVIAVGIITAVLSKKKRISNFFASLPHRRLVFLCHIL